MGHTTNILKINKNLIVAGTWEDANIGKIHLINITKF